MFDLLKKKFFGLTNAIKEIVRAKKEGAVTEKKKEETIKVRPPITRKIAGLIFKELKISEDDVKNTFENFETDLLEADVALPVTERLSTDIKTKIVGRSIKYDELEKFVNQNIKTTLQELLAQEKFDIVQFVRQRPKPVKLLFVGPNGAGKTSTMAKVANLLLKNDYKCLFSASDTFRAAAIEQTAAHAKSLGITVISHKYGADPAAVAFDAIKHAEADGIDVVLIDTAGRQETNRNLIEELRKIVRIAKPDLTIFVGEAIVGNAIISQIQQFNAAVKIDGVILTKIDCDAKGGAALSIKSTTGIPILYLTVGQKHDDIVTFSAEFIIDRIFT